VPQHVPPTPPARATRFEALFWAEANGEMVQQWASK
jgi:hypothetical protein